MGLTLGIRGAVLTLSVVLPAILPAGVCMAQLVASPRDVAGRDLATAVEYFHQGFGHYFITAFQAEAASLDANPASGWTRTGNSFPVEQAVRTGLQPACRFFSDAFPPKSSHFYTPHAAECTSLKGGKIWQYEAISFYLRLPDSTGQCIAGTEILYRLYNNGISGAPNHRYTANAGLFATMQAAGWTAEGDGVTGAFACIPAPPVSAVAGRIDALTLGSSQLGYQYPIRVYLPASYNAATAKYATFYLTDADVFEWGKFSDAVGALQRSGAEAILVGIGGFERRNTDFLFPGAYAYHDFLTKELVPAIEQRYRTDKTARILEGHSLGGLFAVVAMLLEAPDNLTFSRYFSSDATLGPDQSLIATMEQQMHDRAGGRGIPVSIVLGHGLTADTNGPDVGVFSRLLASRNYPSLRLVDIGFPGTHSTVWFPALDAALTELLP